MRKRVLVMPQRYCLFAAAAFLIPLRPAFAQAYADEEFHSTRIGISAGMGVNYHNAQDIVDRVNGSGYVNRRVDTFKSAVEFFGAVTIPLSHDWVAKVEYVYAFANHSLPSRVIAGFNEDFSYALHMPTIIGQYLLYEAQSYNFKAGIGLGFHFATYEEKLTVSGYRGTASGPGSLLELEGNTALGEDLFAHLGAQIRWEFIGALKDSAGRSPLGAAPTTMHFFSVGARLGMSYYF